MNGQFYTYLHCKPDGAPFYVGKGCGRRAFDLVRSRNKKHKDVQKKYGSENIKIFIFPCESEKVALDDEMQQIAQLKNEGYDLANFTEGGEGSSGAYPSREVRAKMSAASKGVPKSKEHREKIAAAHAGKKKRKHSAEANAKKSARMIGNKLGAGVPSSRKGKRHSPESIAKMSAAKIGNKHFLGKSHSTETRAKISAARLKKSANKRKDDECLS